MVMLRKDSPTILAVDDDRASRSACALILRNRGFEVWEADTGQEALRLAKREPDLVLLDVELPDTDGFEVCRRIKNIHGAAEPAVLMMSGVSVQTQDRVHGLQDG